MKDMKSIIGRTILAFIGFIVIITIYWLYGETGEDKIVEYIKEKVELQNKEEIRKIEFVKYKKNTSTGTWYYEVILNDKIELSFTAWRKSDEVVLSSFDGNDINLIKNKNHINESNIEVIYEK